MSVEPASIAEHRYQHPTRSSSLLSRLRQSVVSAAPPPMPASPTPSTSSSTSSKGNRSDRTLSHSTSAGSMRKKKPSDSSKRPSVRVLPPAPNAVAGPPYSKKRRSKSSPNNGFISQLLKPNSSQEPTVSPRTQLDNELVVNGGAPSSSSSVTSIDTGYYSAGPLPPTSSAAAHQQMFAGYGQHPAYYSSANMMVYGGHPYAPPPPPPPQQQQQQQHHHHHQQQQQQQQQPNVSNSDIGSQLVSALPVYEPIDMARIPSVSDQYVASRPLLPDARMLAPMASLAEVFGTDCGALSNRELRFAVENHMLVEQHRYLIRDLGHARSAITALKQVVQAKEDRCEHWELSHMEMQQRVELLESMLTQEQKQQLLAMGQQQLEEEGRDASIVSSSSATADVDQPSAGMDTPAAEDANEIVTTGGATRPLSGYATVYSLSDKPIHHLPRVISGDYGSAMEDSVEALTHAMASMPRDDRTVDEIIASKVTPTSSPAVDSSAQTMPQITVVSSPKPTAIPEATAPTSTKQPTKRRSRILSALRLSSFSGSSITTNSTTTSTAKSSNRRSVSLGNSSKPKTVVNVVKAKNSSPGSLVASCPTLAPAAKKQQKILIDATGGGNYPANKLGLGTSEGEKKRLSFNPHPRRSTSAPSRPHSMRVSSRHSWLSSIFGGGKGLGRKKSNEEIETDEEEEEEGDPKQNRRRVLTQSSDEVSRMLNSLRLDKDDVIDEDDDEQNSGGKPAQTVAEVRQQTLDALNGNPPRTSKTIQRLDNGDSNALGLGVNMNNNNSSTQDMPPAGNHRERRSMSWDINNRTTDGNNANKKWAPAFWAPPPLSLSQQTNANSMDTNDDLFDASVMSALLGRRMSEGDTGLQMEGRSPRTSTWEIATGADTSSVLLTAPLPHPSSRTMVFSPTSCSSSSHSSRPGTPPPPQTAAGVFNEDPNGAVVTSSEATDGLLTTMSAAVQCEQRRRSQSLRMSSESLTGSRRSATFQRSIDGEDLAMSFREKKQKKKKSLSFIDDDSFSKGRRNGGVMSRSGVEKDDGTQLKRKSSKRRSLLWQFNLNKHQRNTSSTFTYDDVKRIDSSSSSSDDDEDGGNTTEEGGGSECTIAPPHAHPVRNKKDQYVKKPRRWWSAVLG